jgi:hypothetical protein
MVEGGKQLNTEVAESEADEPEDEVETVAVAVAVVVAVIVGVEVGPMERHNYFVASHLELQDKFG